MSKQKRANGDGSLFKRGSRWWIAFYDENGERQIRSTRQTDKRNAQRMLDAETDRVKDILAGRLDPTSERLAEAFQRPVDELVTMFGERLRAEGRTEKYVGQTESEIRDFVKATGVVALGDVTAEKASAYLESLRKKGRSARTRQSRITSVKGFTRWAWREGLLAADPLAGLKRPNPNIDRRRRRRMLLVDEWRWLDSVVGAAGPRFGMAPEARRLLYALALQTGLRAGELRSIRRSNLHLTGKQAFVVIEAGSTKNRRVARQFVRPELAERLRRHSARLAPGAPLFKLPPDWQMAKMLRADLADARAAWIDAARNDPKEHAERHESDFLREKDSERYVIDFHALRHTCGAWAAIGGASPKAVQTLMRHSTITLTLDTYDHLLPDEAAETVGRLPGFDCDQSEAATGTTDADAECSNGEPECSNRVYNAGANGREDEPSETERRGETESDEVLASIGGGPVSSDQARPETAGCENAPRRTRTFNPLIKSQLLCQLS